MLKVHVNANRQDVVLSYTMGQQFPKVEGRLVSVEVSGKELASFLEKNAVPLVHNVGMVIAWHGKHAGRALHRLRAVFDAD